MNKYKSYGKGWHFESYRHSLAAKGILTRIKKEAATPILGYTAVPEMKKMSEARAKELIIAGALSKLPKSAEEKMALRELELTLRPRERRGVRIMKLITQKISPPVPFEGFEHYKDKIKGSIEEFMPLNIKVDVRLPVRGGGRTGVVTAEPPSAEEYIDYLLDHRYKYHFGYYDPSIKDFTSSPKKEVVGFETYGGRALRSEEAKKFSEAPSSKETLKPMKLSEMSDREIKELAGFMVRASEEPTAVETKESLKVR